MSEPIRIDRNKDDDIRWLALLIRQGLKLIVAGIERRYGLDDSESRTAVVK